MVNVCVMGLGYVGTVAAACIAEHGARVTGVDIDAEKVRLLGEGKPSFVEPGLDALLAAAKEAGRLAATVDPAPAVAEADVVLVTVGTPSGVDGRPDLRALTAVCEDIGAGLKARKRPGACTVVLRSTCPPGTTRERVIPAIERACGHPHGQGWTCVFAPEFLREGSAIADFRDPPQTIVGALDPAHARPYVAVLGPLTAPLRVCALETAELMKYACNYFHALKIAFANEIGSVARTASADGREVMELVCEDRVLNISPAYMRPGNAFGGSCLPKDLKGLGQIARDQGLDLPLLRSVMPANDAQIQRLVRAIQSCPGRRVGVAGIAFKDNTDDLRDSAMVRVVRELLLHGFEVAVWDRHVALAALRGRNEQFIRMGIPQLGELMVQSPLELARRAETVVVARKLDVGDEALMAALRQRDVLDLVGQPEIASLPGHRTVFW